MGFFTLAGVMSEATAHLGNRIDISLSRASLYANQAHTFIWNTAPVHDRSEGIAISSTTSGENKITLPPDLQELTTVSNLSNVPPYPLIQWQVADIDSNHTYLGAPTNYVRYNEWLE